jgi:hypothetical protein
VAPPPARAQPGAVRIVVDDPVKKAEAGLIPGYSSGYVLYRVATVSKLPSYRSERASVRRRFRDFVVCHAATSPHHHSQEHRVARCIEHPRAGHTNIVSA